MKTSDNIKELRLQGKSLKEISKELSLSKSNVSYHLNKMNLQIPVAKKNLEYRAISALRASIQRSKNIVAMKDLWRLEAEELYATYKLDPSFTTFISLYWGEGAKRNSSSIRIANSDPCVIMCSAQWLEKLSGRCCNYKWLHIYEDQNKEELVEYWSKELNIDTKDIKVHVKKSTKSVKTYKGTFYLGINDIKLFTKLLHWIDLHREEIRKSYGK